MQAIIIGAGRGQRLDADHRRHAQVLRRSRREAPPRLDARRVPGQRHRSHLLHRRLPDRQGAARLPGVHLSPQRRLGEQQHPGVAVLRRGPDERAVHLLLLRHPVHPATSFAEPWPTRTTWRWSSIPLGGSATRTAPSIRPTTPRKFSFATARVTRVARDIDTEQAHGEYIGVAKFSAAGAAQAARPLPPLPADVRRQAVPRGEVVREGVPDSAVPGHDRGRRAVRPRRHARRLHRSRYAAGFRIRPPALAAG